MSGHGVEVAKLLSAPDVAGVLGIEVDTLYRYARKGVIRGIKIGKLWRFSQSDVDAFIRARRAAGPELSAPEADQPTLLPALLSHAARLAGPRPGLIGASGEISFEELDRQSDRLAAALARRGVRRGDRVVLILPNCAEFVVTMFAVWKLRCVLVAESTAIRTENLLHVVRDASPKVMIVDRGVAERFEGSWSAYKSLSLVLIKDRTFMFSGGEAFDVDSLDALLAEDAGPMQLPWAAADPEEVASITYTSGSTGLPKGVMHTHRSWLASARFTCEHAEITSRDAILIPLPLYHGLAFRQILSYALVGGTLIIAADVYMALKWLPQHRPTALVLVPAACGIVLDHFATVLRGAEAHMRYIEVGSAPLPPERLGQLMQLLPGTRFLLPYGLTEARVGYLERGEDGKLNQFAAVSPGLRVDVVDAVGAPVAWGETGEIRLRGEGLMHGYWGSSPERLAALRGEGFRTGDVGRVNGRGRIELVGRLDDVLKVGGKKVVPQEVEQVLNRHPAVAESGVVGKPDPSGIFETRLCAHVVLKRSTDVVAERELLDFARQHLEPHKLPAEIHFRKSLPKSSVGKLLRGSL